MVAAKTDWTCPRCGKTIRETREERAHRVRGDVRFPVEIPVSITGLDIAYPGSSLDLSLHGAQLLVPLRRLRSGKIASMTLSLPGKGRSSADIVLPVDIRWTRAVSGEGSMAGVKFFHTPSSLQLLAKLLRGLDDGVAYRKPRPAPPPPHECVPPRKPKPRRETRQRVALPVLVAVPDGAITGEVCDLSKSGLMLRSPYMVPPGRKVIVRLESPSVPIILPLEATVKWVRMGEKDALAGLAFERAPDAKIARLFFDALGSATPLPAPAPAAFKSTTWRARPGPPARHRDRSI